MSGDVDPRDFSRRTLLANERTFLAWYRTGLAAVTAALAIAQVVPRLAHTEHRWPYTVIGVLLALAGTLCLGYGEWRRVAVDRAVRRGEFAEPSVAITLLLTITGLVTGIGLTLVIIFGS